MSETYSPFEQVITVLKDAQGSIDLILVEPEHQNHRLKLHHELQRQMENLNLLTRSGDVRREKVNMGPAKTIMGQSIESTQPKVEPVDLDPKADKVANLKAQVDQAHSIFLTTDNNEILKTMDDTVIRGVAKKAGIKGVTKDQPKNLSVKFVQLIKDAMEKESEELEQRIEAAAVKKIDLAKVRDEANAAHEAEPTPETLAAFNTAELEYNNASEIVAALEKQRA